MAELLNLQGRPVKLSNSDPLFNNLPVVNWVNNRINTINVDLWGLRG